MFNKNFLTADVIQFVSGTMTTFSQGDGTKIKSKQFSVFSSQTTEKNDFASMWHVRQFDFCGIYLTAYMTLGSY